MGDSRNDGSQFLPASHGIGNGHQDTAARPRGDPSGLTSQETLLHQQKSILRNSVNRISEESVDTSRIELADHRRSSRKGVRFSDGSSPGRQNTPEDERRKVPCYEPSPQAIGSRQLDIPEESWSDMLRHTSDINSLKQLLDQTSLTTDSTAHLPDHQANL